MDNQYETVVLRKNGPRSGKGMNARAMANAKANGSVQTVKRQNYKGVPSNAGKLDAETENFRHQKVSHSFKVALQKARQAKKMTRKQLAAAIGVKESVVGEYENGKAIPNPQIISKMSRALGCKLPKIPKKKKVQG